MVSNIYLFIYFATIKSADGLLKLSLGGSTLSVQLGSHMPCGAFPSLVHPHRKATGAHTQILQCELSQNNFILKLLAFCKSHICHSYCLYSIHPWTHFHLYSWLTTWGY